MDGERFRLLSWQISGDLNGMPEIATLQNGYVVTILTLYYFVKVIENIYYATSQT